MHISDSAHTCTAVGGGLHKSRKNLHLSSSGKNLNASFTHRFVWMSVGGHGALPVGEPHPVWWVSFISFWTNPAKAGSGPLYCFPSDFNLSELIMWVLAEQLISLTKISMGENDLKKEILFGFLMYMHLL